MKEQLLRLGNMVMDISAVLCGALGIVSTVIIVILQFL
jgi:hypothetical protein